MAGKMAGKRKGHQVIVAQKEERVVEAGISFTTAHAEDATQAKAS